VYLMTGRTSLLYLMTGRIIYLYLVVADKNIEQNTTPESADITFRKPSAVSIKRHTSFS